MLPFNKPVISLTTYPQGCVAQHLHCLFVESDNSRDSEGL
jgi:hypothetical protein